MKSDTAGVVDKAREYYDSSDADNFYFQIWGGEDIHVGWYESAGESIFDASRRTVERMSQKLKIPEGADVLDIGAGYGGSARFLAATRKLKVTALNLSVVQNERDRQLNRRQGLDDMVDVVDGNFEELPFDNASYDAVWSQDAILHSSDRRKVFREVDRVLRPGGEFIFTDPMQREGVDPELLKPVLARIHLASMGSVGKYDGYARELGWEIAGHEIDTSKLVAHYSRVREELERREEELAAHCSREYIERMKAGLDHWVHAGRNDALAWGILHYRKK